MTPTRSASRAWSGATSPVYDDNPFYMRDYNKCINCWRCVQVCAEDAQYTFALNFDGRGFHTMIGTFMGDGMMDTTCVFCGQCVGVCPTNALKPKRQFLLEQRRRPRRHLPPDAARGEEEAAGIGLKNRTRMTRIRRIFADR
jgi:predicted molibdopterin-dependent oxidoreductase YjgC